MQTRGLGREHMHGTHIGMQKLWYEQVPPRKQLDWLVIGVLIMHKLGNDHFARTHKLAVTARVHILLTLH